MAVAWLIAPYIARVFTRDPSRLDRLLDPIERVIYRILGVDASHGMGWKEYFLTALLVNIFQMAIGFLVISLQGQPNGVPRRELGPRP